MRDRLAGVGPRNEDEAYKVRDEAPAGPGAPAGWIPAPPQPAPHPMYPPPDGEWIWLTGEQRRRNVRTIRRTQWWHWLFGLASGAVLGLLVGMSLGAAQVAGR